MYSQHFGLTQDPFSIAPDPRYLFMSERHREALAHLLYGVAGPDRAGSGTGGGFVLLTGDIGTGKTTICRCFLEQIPVGCHVAYIFNPKLTVTELLQSICEEFHIAVASPSVQPPTVKAYIDALNAFLLERHAKGQACVLIIDEAQNLQADVLEQLRLLTNLETSERKLLQIVLIGQPELRSMLERPELEQLAQRVIARFHLDALSEAETLHYIEHRMAVAGHHGALPFEPAALKRVHQLAGGVPRRVNLLCGRALLGAWANGLHKVTRAVADQAASEVFGTTPPAPRWAGLTARTLALGGACLLAGAALTGLVLWPARQAQPLQPAPPAAAAAKDSASRATNLRAIPVARAVEPPETLLQRLSGDMRLAWQELATVWHMPVEPGSDPCQTAAAQPLQCYRTTNLTVPMLRQLGRPGILTLQAEGAAPAHAVLVGLDEQTATLQITGQPHTVGLIALGRLWHGDFATYWKAPAGYGPVARGGSSGAAIQELSSRLDQLDGVAPRRAASAPDAKPLVLDEALKARVRAFQRTAGLKADGQPGPLTLMQIEAAVGATSPRLLTPSP
ncbi:MAG: AAA family ATPase [Betaproteobacteria bacterium]|nr:AAA family ATPase [Betaproteobacteria bacterium]